MFGKIIAISKNFALVSLGNNAVADDLLNYNVIFEDGTKRILGEIKEVNNNQIVISFLGEFVDDKFLSGIIRKPSLSATIRIINDNELSILVGNEKHGNMLLGKAPLYNDFPIKVDINEFFSNHSAFFGNTGSGKTYGVARVVQNLFSMGNIIPFNSNLFIFNSTSEYHNSFKDINKINPNFNYKLYSTNIEQLEANSEILRIPLWLMSVDDFANMFDVTSYFQLSVIEQTLSYVSIFAKKDEESNIYQNHLIASAILSVMYSNQVTARIRDQIFSILTTCNTNELNFNVEIPGIGYTRQLRKCFDIDSEGYFVEQILVTKYIEQFIIKDKKWKSDYVPVYFTLEDLAVALNFTLISEGLLLNDKSYGEATALKVKLNSIINGNYGKYFQYDTFVTLNQYITNLIMVDSQRRAQIINFTLEDVDDRFAKAIVKIYSRILFKFTKEMPERGVMPINIMIEEAHRFVQKDIDLEILGYNIFERIAKEGRKFGLVLDLITQRPTELSETVISQCSNFMIFKLNHPTDLEYVRKMVPNISEEIVEKQKTLQAGTCVAFGKMMKIPMIVKMDLPNPEPHSANPDVYARWMVELPQQNNT